jgi:ubiquinone/menaquinone biosynthesis C-methylase UbiE
MMKLKLVFFSLALWTSQAFVVKHKKAPHSCHRSFQLHAASTEVQQQRAPPRTGILQSVLDLMLHSPLWKYVLVPQARKKMKDTAAENGIPWNACREWLETQNGPWKQPQGQLLDHKYIPDYYKRPFHAYEDGNMCWDAALEVEIASKAVGARNFPAYGRSGEDAFRNSFSAALLQSGARFPQDCHIVDLGCGTGISTRRLARDYPQAAKITGIDLSPYYCQVGTFLLNEVAPVKAIEEGGPWVNSIDKDARIQYQVGNAASTALPGSSVDVVNLQFVAHELPYGVTLDILKEAHRILKTGGQLWFCEMDFETPGYSAQRANPLLFSLIRATEPYLDDYADHAQEIRDSLKELFATTIITPATGRHFAIVATKDDSAAEHVLEDNRFDEQGEYRVEDTHLKTFDNKL